MACSSIFTIESDKHFLCCDGDIAVLKVFEIDNLYLTGVQQKHWTLLAALDFGEDQEYEAIRFGDIGIIDGSDLQRLMKDLMSLGMMVNREGLCFLKHETACQVNVVGVGVRYGVPVKDEFELKLCDRYDLYY